jgi:thiamine-monophosphate kinase
VLECSPGKQLIAAIDTLVEGVHFLAESPPASIGHRALAVNLSDLAAMGAEPAWALLALTLREPRDAWLSEFSRGFGALACEHHVALVGGNTTSGPTTVSVQILGFIEPSRALRRSGAQPGDIVFVSGTPGDAAGGLTFELRDHAALAESPASGRTGVTDAPAGGSISIAQSGHGQGGAPESITTLRNRFRFPTPRVALGRRLLDFASACIDVSDGLLGDAGKLAHASGCAIELDYSSIPTSASLVDAFGEQRARTFALSGGEDYELCFTVPPSRVDAMLAALPLERWSYTRIGVIKDGTGARVVNNGTVMDFSHSGWDHFSALR